MMFHLDRMDVQINPTDSLIVKLSNRMTGKEYFVQKENCVIELKQAKIHLADITMDLIAQDDNSCVFVGRQGNLELTHQYNFPAGRDYFDRSLKIKNLSSSKSIVIHKVTSTSLCFAKPFESTLYHDDGLEKIIPGDLAHHPGQEVDGPIVYRGALNVFMRDTDGGVCLGLKYPYFKHELTDDSVSLFCETNYRLNPNETFELPDMFCGVYEKTGYTCRKKLHWAPRVLARSQEEMDWGEVWAMQKILQDFLPEYKCPKPGYFLWLNSWWAEPDLRCKMGSAQVHAYRHLADKVKMSGCVDMLGTAPVWVGWSAYIDTEPAPEIEAIGDDAIFPMNPHIQQFLDYTQSVGLDTFSFCEANGAIRNYRRDRPEWKLQPTEEPASRLKQNCQANDSYANWFYRLVCNVIDTCKLKGWAWDFHWIRRPMICHSHEHGHEPGNCEFQQYRNITDLIQKLRDRYSNHLLEVYWGLKEAGSWSHRGLNGLENLYENGEPAPPGMTLADDLRFQHWHNHNYRFLPTYMNMAQINFNKEANGHVYSILSSLNASTHGSLTDWIDFDSQEEADTCFADLRRWKFWATDHIEYLQDRVDLFGQPCREGGIDGSSHIIEDRGFIFVFNPWSENKWGSIPLNDLIGLKTDQRCSLDEISTGQTIRLAVHNKGDDFIFSIAAKSAMLIELKPTSDDLISTQYPPDIEIQPAFQS